MYDHSSWISLSVPCIMSNIVYVLIHSQELWLLTKATEAGRGLSQLTVQSTAHRSREVKVTGP